MLFVQVALAIAACDIEGRPSRTTALAMQTDTAPASPCHEEAPAGEPLCTAHCQGSEPSLDKTPAPPALAPVSALAPLVLRVPARRELRLPAAPGPTASPPARIRFQTLLI